MTDPFGRPTEQEQKLFAEIDNLITNKIKNLKLTEENKKILNEIKKPEKYYKEEEWREVVIWLNSTQGTKISFDEICKQAYENCGFATSDLMTKYIFDESKVVKKKIFSFLKINDSLAGIGIFLPKDEDIYNKKAELIGTKQVEQPVLLTSGCNLIEIGSRFEEEYKIKFKAIPSNFERRFSLSTVKRYLKREYHKVDGLKLFHKIKGTYQKFLFFTKDNWYNLHSLWDIGTYFLLLFKVYPIFELRGLKRTAKTKTMFLSSLITFNATDIMINPSEATLFRETHDKRPTKYIDEAERLFTFVKGRMIPDQRIEVINSSYFHKGTVPRIEKINNKFVSVYYETYSPTMIGSISGLFGATEDRAIVHITTRPPKNDKRGELEPSEDDPIFQEIRDELYIFLLQNWQEIERIYNNLKNTSTLKDRDYQLWKPLLAIAKHLDEQLYLDIKEFAEQISSEKKFDSISEDSFDYRLLSIVLDYLNGGKERILVKEIKSKYKELYLDAPASKTISSHLDKCGFMEHRKHTRDGSAYLFTKSLFESIVSTICPNLIDSNNSSQSSYLSQSNIEEEKIGDEEVMNTEKCDESNNTDCDECDANDECDGSNVNS